MKDGKCICLGCGNRVDGLLKPRGHAFGCPIGQSTRIDPKPPELPDEETSGPGWPDRK